MTKTLGIKNISQLQSYYIPYRSTLKLAKKATFGVEIEFHHDRIESIFEDLLDHVPICMEPDRADDIEWTLKQESSIIDGWEITSPILKDDPSSWKELATVCEILRKHQAIVDAQAGGHIHMGAQNLGNHPLHWQRFLEFYALYEAVLFRFGAGEFDCLRSHITGYAKPIQALILSQLERNDFFDPSSILNSLGELQKAKYRAIEFTRIGDGNFRKDNTIEFRFPNGSLDPVIWQNNILTFERMIEYAKSPMFDQERIHFLLKEMNPSLSFEEQDRFLWKSFFVQVFSDEREQLSFLRQYQKDGVFSYEPSIVMKKVKPFTQK